LSRSHNARSERIEYPAINTVAFNNVFRCNAAPATRRVHAVDHVIEIGEHSVDYDQTRPPQPNFRTLLGDRQCW
jgi:hypothetical protein